MFKGDGAAWSTVAVTVNETVAFAAMLPIVQVSTPPDGPVGDPVALTKVSPSGRVSLRTTPVAASGSWFVTVSV